MQMRIQHTCERNCSSIEPDSIDGCNNTNAIGQTMHNSINFFTLLSREAMSKGMGIGLKKSFDMIAAVINKLGFAVNEESLNFSTNGVRECTKYSSLVCPSHALTGIQHRVSTGERDSDQKL
jgi:hypothetical protein